MKNPKHLRFSRKISPKAPFHYSSRTTRERTKRTATTEKKHNVALLLEPPARTLFVSLSVLLLLASRSRRGDIFDDMRAVQTSRREQDKKSSDFKGEVRHRLRDALHERRGEIARGENRAGKVRRFFSSRSRRSFFFPFCRGVCLRRRCSFFLSFFLSFSFVRSAIEFLSGGKGTTRSFFAPII